MATIFSDLSYSKAKPLAIGRPVEDLTALYKKKDEDYNYVIDNLNKTETALNNVPHHEKDTELIQAAKDKYKTTFEEYSEVGDFENRRVDTKMLANDLANNYGLLEAQKVAQTKQAYIEDLKKRYDDGDISLDQMNRTIQDAEDKYEGLQYNDETESYVGNYSMRSVPKNLNFAQEVAKVLEGFKANTVILTDKNGNQILPDSSGSGYFITGTNESVSEEDLIFAAKSYLQNDPKFNDKIQDDLYYETKNLLYNRETGERRQMTTDDLKALMGNQVTKQIAEKLGITNIDNLQEELEKKGLSIEQLYSKIRQDQMINSAIAMGVEKESYDKYQAKYLDNWLLKDKLGSGPQDYTMDELGILDTWLTTNSLTTEDTKNIAKINDSAQDNLDVQEEKLNDLQLQYNKNPNDVNPQDISTLEKEIEKSKRVINLTTNRLSDVINSNEEVRKSIKSVLGNSFDANQAYESRDIYNYENRYMDDIGIKGLSINQGSLERLVMKAVNNELTTDELQKYIQLNKNQELADAYRKNSDFGLQGTNQEQIYQAILQNGMEALEGETPTLKDKVMSSYNDRVSTSVNILKTKVNNIKDLYEQKVEADEVNYSKSYKIFNPPEMSASDRRSNPIQQLTYMSGNITKNNVNYYTGLSSTLSGLDIKTAIEQEYDVSDEAGQIKWDKGKLIPSMDSMADLNTGDYAPVMVFQVPIVKGDKLTETVQFPVNYTEPSYIAKYKEAVVDYRQTILNKAKTTPLDESDSLLLDRLNTNLYNLSNYGKELDMLNLYNAENGETIPFEYWNENGSKHETQIKAYKYGSASNMSFYLTEGKGANEKFWALDREGNYLTVTEKDLKEGQYTALGANTTQDLKTLFSNIIFDRYAPENTKENYKIDLQNTADITEIFGNDIKQGVVPRVNSNLIPDLKVLKNNFPSLIVTDSLRTANAGYGSKTSNHKVGKALDFRLKDPQSGKINQDALRLTKLSQTELSAMGIKSAEIHDNNHVHVEFLDK